MDVLNVNFGQILDDYVEIVLVVMIAKALVWKLIELLALNVVMDIAIAVQVKHDDNVDAFVLDYVIHVKNLKQVVEHNL